MFATITTKTDPNTGKCRGQARVRVRVCASRVSRAPDVLWGGSFPWPDGESDSNQSDQGNGQHQHPRATDGGNKDDPAHHWAAILALCSPHCQVGIGLQRPLPHDDQDLPLCLPVAVAVASAWPPPSLSQARAFQCLVVSCGPSSSVLRCSCGCACFRPLSMSSYCDTTPHATRGEKWRVSGARGGGGCLPFLLGFTVRQSGTDSSSPRAHA